MPIGRISVVMLAAVVPLAACGGGGGSLGTGPTVGGPASGMPPGTVATSPAPVRSASPAPGASGSPAAPSMPGTIPSPIPSASSASAFTPAYVEPPMSSAGTWIKDATGRTVIVHGLQLEHKTAPYHAIPASFTDTDGALMEANGFTAVRLGWSWSGLEPAPGHYDMGYLAELMREGDILARHHILTQLEAHQDIYSEAVDGNGFPNWATYTDGIPALPAGSSSVQFAPPATIAFDNLYANHNGVADAFYNAWTVMATGFASNPQMLGYDMYNEPNPGSAASMCTNPAGCPTFDMNTLMPFQNGIAAAIRKADRTNIVFYEPDIEFDGAAKSYLTKPPASSGPSGFVFHDYCTQTAGFVNRESQAPAYASCGPEDQLQQQNVASQQAVMNVPAILNEFGATRDLPSIRRVIDDADSHAQGWLYWAYKAWQDIPGYDGDGSLFANSDDNSTLRTDLLGVVSETYPMATAGTPGPYAFDPATRIFTYTYAPDPSVRTPTLIFVPTALHYAKGYTVTVTGANVISPANSNYLELRAVDGATSVALTVRPT